MNLDENMPKMCYFKNKTNSQSPRPRVITLCYYSVLLLPQTPCYYSVLLLPQTSCYYSVLLLPQAPCYYSALLFSQSHILLAYNFLSP